MQHELQLLTSWRCRVRGAPPGPGGRGCWSRLGARGFCPDLLLGLTLKERGDPPPSDALTRSWAQCPGAGGTRGSLLPPRLLVREPHKGVATHLMAALSKWEGGRLHSNLLTGTDTAREAVALWAAQACTPATATRLRQTLAHAEGRQSWCALQGRRAQCEQTHRTEGWGQ